MDKEITTSAAPRPPPGARAALAARLPTYSTSAAPTRLLLHSHWTNCPCARHFLARHISRMDLYWGIILSSLLHLNGNCTYNLLQHLVLTYFLRWVSSVMCVSIIHTTLLLYPFYYKQTNHHCKSIAKLCQSLLAYKNHIIMKTKQKRQCMF